ncbi:hypothetical protein QN277_008465 [Acacia crassicarpa]|uniref:Uncharacterized protein n=1 Tax=Acacia crassicarpa TaxID=499986 RepID=A0AAE1IRB8_9FABA|nr:hypothetical protein QN277_008465 [Acacia crassicarpa]
MFIELLNSEEGTSGHTEKGKKGERKIHSFREFPKFVCLYVFFLAFFLVSSFFQRLGFYRNIHLPKLPAPHFICEFTLILDSVLTLQSFKRMLS